MSFTSWSFVLWGTSFSHICFEGVVSEPGEVERVSRERMSGHYVRSLGEAFRGEVAAAANQSLEKRGAKLTDAPLLGEAKAAR